MEFLFSRDYSLYLSKLPEKPYGAAVRITLMLFTLAFNGVAAATAAESLNQNRLEYIDAAEQGIRANLRDGTSAEFRNELTVSSRGRTFVCGEVNSKNGFGGYTGYQHYVAGGETAFVEENFAPGEFARLWNRLCVTKNSKHKAS